MLICYHIIPTTKFCSLYYSKMRIQRGLRVLDNDLTFRLWFLGLRDINRAIQTQTTFHGGSHEKSGSFGSGLRWQTLATGERARQGKMESGQAYGRSTTTDCDFVTLILPPHFKKIKMMNRIEYFNSTVPNLDSGLSIFIKGCWQRNLGWGDMRRIRDELRKTRDVGISGQQKNKFFSVRGVLVKEIEGLAKMEEKETVVVDREHLRNWLWKCVSQHMRVRYVPFR